MNTIILSDKKDLIEYAFTEEQMKQLEILARNKKCTCEAFIATIKLLAVKSCVTDFVYYYKPPSKTIRRKLGKYLVREPIMESYESEMHKVEVQTFKKQTYQERYNKRFHTKSKW